MAADNASICYMEDAPSFWPQGYADKELFDLYEELEELHGGAVLSTPQDELRKKGNEAPEPSSVKDEDLPEVIKKLVFDLADINVLLECIEHLPDRELYELLWERLLNEPTVLFPEGDDSHYHWDVLGGCSEEDIDIYLRYYADEEHRQHWAEEFGDPLPPSELPPYPKPWLHADETWPI